MRIECFLVVGTIRACFAYLPRRGLAFYVCNTGEVRNVRLLG